MPIPPTPCNPFQRISCLLKKKRFLMVRGVFDSPIRPLVVFYARLAGHGVHHGLGLYAWMVWDQDKFPHCSRAFDDINVGLCSILQSIRLSYDRSKGA